MSSKKIKINCNICYSNKETLGCKVCSFECCEDCIVNWSKTSYLCPQCRNEKTYNIHYEEIEEEEEEIYQEIEEIEEEIITIYDNSFVADHEEIYNYWMSYDNWLNQWGNLLEIQQELSGDIIINEETSETSETSESPETPEPPEP